MMRSQLPPLPRNAPSPLVQAAASATGPVLRVTIKFLPVLQSEICKGTYRAGHTNCPITAQKAEFLKESYVGSRTYPLSQGKRVALPLVPKFQNTLTSCIDAGNYAMLVEFAWGIPLLAVIVDMVPDHEPSELPPGSSGSQRQFDRSQAVPYGFGAQTEINAVRRMRAGPLWYTHQNAKDFEPAESIRWKLILNDGWYGFYVKPAA